MVGFLSFTTGLLLGFIVACVMVTAVINDKLDEATRQIEWNVRVLETIEDHLNKEEL